MSDRDQDTRVCEGECGRRLPMLSFELQGSSRHLRRKRCRRCRGAKQRRYAPAAAEPTKRFTRKLDAKRFLITGAQNATDVDLLFFATLQLAADAMGAELVVVPFRYKNPTRDFSETASDEWWHDLLTPYLFNTRKKLCDSLVLVGDVKIQATASSPLTGFESLTGAESCIIAHPKMQYRSVPVPSGLFPKILSTTGVCTKRNYSDTKAGALGQFHHFLGALVVDLDGSQFRMRQINADRKDGSFIDLDKLYTTDGVVQAPPALALTMGDTHVRFTSKDVDRATFGPGGIVETLNPDELIWHDTLDGYAINPHHIGNPFIAQVKYQAGLGDVRGEVEEAIRFVCERSVGRRSVIVPSNHDNFLSRWIVQADWKQNPANARFYLETAMAMLDSAKRGEGGAQYADPFRYWVEKLKTGDNVRALNTDESHTVAGIEMGCHGDKGPNGARGTLKNMSRLGTKLVTAHDHTGGIEEGNYKVGTSTPLKLEYTSGPSSWRNTHCVTYANGKRALISIDDGKWRGPQ